MKQVIFVAILGIALVAGTSGNAAAGKRDGTSCRSSKSCTSKFCEIPPGQKAGTCCVRQDCAAQSAQCGVVSDGCTGQLDCGSCGANLDCVSNTCPGTMCGGWPVIYDYYPDGSYQYTCYGCSVDNCVLGCFCRDLSDVGEYTTLDIGQCDAASNDIANIHGILTCEPKATTTTIP